MLLFRIRKETKGGVGVRFLLLFPPKITSLLSESLQKLLSERASASQGETKPAANVKEQKTATNQS